MRNLTKTLLIIPTLALAACGTAQATDTAASTEHITSKEPPSITRTLNTGIPTPKKTEHKPKVTLKVTKAKPYIPPVSTSKPTVKRVTSVPTPTRSHKPTNTISRSSTRPVTRVTRTPRVSKSGMWDKVAQCESTGNWHINTGNGYYGGVQTSLSTWNAYGGQQFAARPDLATKEQQIIIANRILAGQGIGAWPVCGKQ